ncbi:MAG: MFS transporter [Candidatus Woesearchaeota archaeon]
MLKETDKKNIEKTKKCSIKDGAAWSVMYGFGEQYIVPFALKLGATASQIGILSSVPAFIGSLFQVAGAKLTDKYSSRKKIVTIFVFFQALLMIPLFILPFITKNFLVLTLLFTIYYIFANIVGPAWSSWISDVVDEKERSLYFGRRNKIVIISTMISVLIAGIILNYFEKINIWIGFGVLFSIAFIGRLISWYYLIKQFEPKYTSPEKETFLSFIKNMQNTNFGNFIIFRSLMAFSIMIAGPFFAVFMLKEAGFSYIQYTILILVPMASKALTMTYWGKYANKYGTRNILVISGAGVALIPLFWFLAGYLFSDYILFYLLIIIEIFSGFAWAGFELTTFNYVIETVSPEKRARSFAYFNLIFGTLVLLGGLSGSFLINKLPNWGSKILLLFLISAIMRLIVITVFSSKIKEVKVSRRINENKLFFELIIAKPVNYAITHTSITFLNTERDVKNFVDTTKDKLLYHSKPALKKIDKTLDKLNSIKEKIEPEKLKKYRKKAYQELTDTNINKKLEKFYNKKRKK